MRGAGRRSQSTAACRCRVDVDCVEQRRPRAARLRARVSGGPLRLDARRGRRPACSACAKSAPPRLTSPQRLGTRNPQSPPVHDASRSSPVGWDGRRIGTGWAGGDKFSRGRRSFPLSLHCELNWDGRLGQGSMRMIGTLGRSQQRVASGRSMAMRRRRRFRQRQADRMPLYEYRS